MNRSAPAAGTAAKQAKIRVPLWLGCRLGRLLQPFGIDQPRFRALLEVRLLDGLARRQHNANDGRGQAFAGGFWLTTLLYLMFGVLLGGVLGGTEQPVLGLTLVFGFLMVFVTMSVMAEHAQTMLETSDLAVLGPLPVDGRTVLASRVVHTLVYFLTLLGTLGGPPLIAGLVRFGPWPFVPMFLLSLALATATCIGLALVLLVGLLRFGGSRRVGSLLLFAQVGASLLSFASFQSLPLLRHASAGWLTSPGSAWPWLLPPVHQAALVAAALPGDEPTLPGPAALGLAIPLLLLLAVALLAKDFQRRLLGLQAAERTIRPPRRRWLRDLLLKDREAIAGYDFGAAMAGRERRFKMMTWPPIAMAWFLAVWGTLRLSQGDHAWDARVACSALYLVGMLMAQILPIARFTDDWQARWLFRANPLRAPGRFTAGAVLALAVRFVLPALLATTVLVAWLVRDHPLDPAFALCGAANLTLFGVRTQENKLPFTQQFAPVQGNMARAFLLTFVAGLFGGLQMLLSMSTTALAFGLAGNAALLILQCSAFASSLRNPRKVAIDWVDDDHAGGRRGAKR